MAPTYSIQYHNLWTASFQEMLKIIVFIDIKHSWRKPKQDEMKINSDGAYNAETGGGWG